jgi:hypothetical protein
MALGYQAFIDESTTEDHEFVLGGHIATAEAWAGFASEWEKLLPQGTIAKNGKYHFKMKDMARSEDRLARTELFYRVIEKYVTTSISCRVNLIEFRRGVESARNYLMQSIHVIADFKLFENPYVFAFRGMLDMFHMERERAAKIIPIDSKVDFVFDNRSEKSPILKARDDFMNNQQEYVRDCYGATPRFEDDQDFLPLQAADLWAWWVREWYEQDPCDNPIGLETFNFGKWRGKDRSNIVITFDEKGVAGFLIETLIHSYLQSDTPPIVVGPSG